MFGGRLSHFKNIVPRLKRETLAVYFAFRHPLTPWYAKVIAFLVAAYAVSPIDLIPDPIPVIGYLDDLLLVPLGIAIVTRMIPAKVMTECRERAKTYAQDEQGVRNLGRLGACLVLALWLSTGILLFISFR